MQETRHGSPLWLLFREAPKVRAVLLGFAMQVMGAQAIVLWLVFVSFAAGEVLAAGIVLAGRSLPYVLSALYSGWLYDRFPVRKLVWGAALLEAGAVVFSMWVMTSELFGSGSETAWGWSVLAAIMFGAAGAVRETIVGALAVDRGREAAGKAGEAKGGEAGAIGVGLAFDAGKLLSALVLLVVLLSPVWGALLAAVLIILGGLGVAWASPAESTRAALAGESSAWGEFFPGKHRRTVSPHGGYGRKQGRVGF